MGNSEKLVYFFSLIFSVNSNPLSSLYYYVQILQSRSSLIFHLPTSHFYQITWKLFVLNQLMSESFLNSWSIHGFPCFCQRRLRCNCVCVCVCVCVCLKERELTREKATGVKREKKSLLLWNWSHLSSFFPFYPSSFIFLPPKCNTSTV